MNFIAAPMPANENRRQEAVERLKIKGTDQHDVMIVYSEMAQELTGFAAVAATLFATIQVLDAGSADTMRGSLKELEAIAAAVVGGCLLTGGYGSAIGAAFGALIFGTVSMGIFYTDVDTDLFKVFLGAMMLIAVLFNNYIRKKVTESK